jgi:protein O-GlcNAc transferase
MTWEMDELQKGLQVKKNRTPPEHLTKELIGYFSVRNYAVLEQRAQEIIAIYPDFAFAWKALSVAQTLTGGDALPAARRAAALLPRDAEAQNNCAKALLDAGQSAEARDKCIAALKIDAGNVLAMNNLGNACRQMGRFDEALNAYRNALARAPNYFEAAFNLGTLLSEAGDPEGAVAAFELALRLQPAHQSGVRLLARQLTLLGRLEDAIKVMRVAANQTGASVDLLDEFAGLWIEAGEHAQALAIAERALALAPQHASVHNRRGAALLGLGRLSQAQRAFEQSIASDATHAKVWMNLGNVLRDLLRGQEALAAYGKAIELEPTQPEIFTNLLMASNYLGLSDGPLIDAALAIQDRRAVACTSWVNDADPARPLRVGLVSGDLREHPVGRFLVAPLAALRGRAIDVFAYSNHGCSDKITVALQASIGHWRNIHGVSDDKVVEIITADQIDLLVDLSGHTGGGRLNVFARKPAPLQATWFGYFATTGIKAIDYVIADPVVLPPSEETHFVEKVWRLPGTYYCYTPPQFTLDGGPLPALRTGHITFACFNNAAKLNPQVLSCWAEILKALPSSKLYLKSSHFSQPEVVATLTERFEMLGIGMERLIFEAADGFERYLAAYRRVDIALDPFPFTGGATTADALWMGVPVLSLKGQRFISHQGETILNSVGLNDWIASGHDEYIALALAKAGNLEALSDLRHSLRERLLASAFVDAVRFSASLEAVWRGMWVKWCAEQQGVGAPALAPATAACCPSVE